MRQPEALRSSSLSSASAISGRTGTGLVSGTLSTATPALPERTRFNASLRPFKRTKLASSASPCRGAPAATGKGIAVTGGGNGTATFASKKLETGAPANDSTAASNKTLTTHPPVYFYPRLSV